jgi:chromosomal replication initiation ATPase DnaA
MAYKHPEFPFVKSLPRQRPQPHRGRTRSKVERAMRREANKSKAMRRIIAVVEAVTDLRKIPYKDMFSKKRENPTIAAARVLSMGLCCALDVPICIVARAFDRRWHTVYGAEESCSRRYKRSEGFRKEWNAIVATVEKSPALKTTHSAGRKATP